MIAIDANLLLYAYETSAREHEQSRAWFEATLASRETVGLPLVSVLAFLRIATDRRVRESALTPDKAMDAVNSWFARKNVIALQPGARHWTLLAEILYDSNSAGHRITDAHLAALAIEHGATLCTNDRDFRRFQNLDVHFPLRENG